MEITETCKILGETISVCPDCLKVVPAYKVKYCEQVFMEKACPEHGNFKTLIWNGLPEYESWGAFKRIRPDIKCITKVEKGCPYDCGLCPEHRQGTCCVLLEVTARCNLRCPVCFASAGGENVPDPSLEDIGRWYDTLMEHGGPFNIQLSGGEPTVREDLPRIIRLGKQKGFTFFQLNTNGLRLAEEPEYCMELKEAGLNCVFLQFDGMRDDTYKAIRGRELFEKKKQAIENCSKAGLGVVLVPTLVPGINIDEIGAIIDFAVEKLPHVRGVHFQPISYFGRFGNAAGSKTAGDTDAHVTIPDVIRAIVEQTNYKIKPEDFKPATAENAYCSFNASFLLQPDGSLKVLPKKNTGCCSGDTGSGYSPGNSQGTRSGDSRDSGSCCSPGTQAGAPQDTGNCCPETLAFIPADASKRAREFVARQWGSVPKISNKIARWRTPKSFDEFLEYKSLYTLAISGMAFQDAWNLDLDRLKECYIHVVSPDNRIIPFCAYNLTSRTGIPLYRNK